MQLLIYDLKAIFDAAVRGAQPDKLLCGFDPATELPGSLEDFGRIRLVGAGKAAMAMAGAVEQMLCGLQSSGQVVVPAGYPAAFPVTQHVPAMTEVLEAEHPVPGRRSLLAAERALSDAMRCSADDLLVVLLSGGGSALWCLPSRGLRLEHLRRMNRLLLHSGADIHEINTVRKHLSRIKGGWLAAAAWPAAVLTLAISDVPFDDRAVIASGPTVPDASTFEDVIAVLERYGIWDAAPAPVRRHLRDGVAGRASDTPKPGTLHLETSRTRIIGSNQHALSSAAKKAATLGYVPTVQRDVTGEARKIGHELARAALQQPRRSCLIWGGETTVRVTGRGVGGRNHEAALAAALALTGTRKQLAVFSGGTDGIDGVTGAAGAWATSATVPAALARGLDAHAALEENDSYTFFSAIDGSVVTGPTHTNVMDVLIALVH